MIQVVHRIQNILKYISESPGGNASLSDIADSLGLNRATCANLLKEMKELGMVEQDGYRKHYTIGYALYQLTGSIKNYSTSLRFANKIVDELCESIDENCILAAVRGGTRIILHQAIMNSPVNAVTQNELPAYKATTGRMILSWYCESEIKGFIKQEGLPGNDWPEIKTKGDLLQALETIRETEYLLVENTATCIISSAAPIFNHGKIIAALGFYMPTSRYSEKKAELFKSRVLAAAEKINEKLK